MEIYIPEWAQGMTLHSTYLGVQIYTGKDGLRYRWMPKNKVLVTDTLGMMRYYARNPNRIPAENLRNAKEVGV